MGRRLARQIDASLIHSIVKKVPASICLFGCKRLDLTVSLKELGHKVLAVEPDAAALACARDAGIDVLKGYADSPLTEIPDNSFDAIYLDGALSECLELRLALQNVSRRLVSGGHLFAEVPNHSAFSAERSGPAWFLSETGRNLNFLTGASLSRFVESTGLDLKDMLYRQFVPQFVLANHGGK